jgi:acyl-CoA synthetase (AMP-forming)/AMP-acid ligase II/3-hydroxymyristoyl/3-hydroxydecanoyl-(acyl carrier protein) dehydratase
MAEFIPLQRLLATGRVDEHRVALRAGAPVCFPQFRDAVLGWQRSFVRSERSNWALYFEDSADFAAALFGVWHAGGCAHLPADARPATLARVAQRVDGFAGALPRELAPVGASATSATRETWSELDLDAEAVVVWTSGSTGDPLPVAKSLRQLAAETAALSVCWDSRLGDSRVLASVPHQHAFGLLFALLWPLAAGRPFATQRVAHWQDLRAAAGDEPVTLITSPAYLKRLPLGSAGAALRAVFAAGGGLPVETSEQSSKYLGIVPTEIYGTTETGAIAWRESGSTHSNWCALPGVELEVVHDSLRVRSRHLPDLSWHACADRVQWRDGGFELLGRADRIVKIEERRVSLEGVERELRSSPLVSDVRALVLAGKRAELAAVVQPSAAGWALIESGGRPALNRALQAVLVATLEHAVLPRRWRYVDDLPVDSMGKSSSAVLEALFDPRRPFTRVLARTASTVEMTVTFPGRSPYFDGHFAAAPVLPGVAQLEWIILLARELFDLIALPQRLEAIKFHRVVAPDTELLLTLEYSVDTRSLRYRIRTARQAVAGGRIVFGASA